ncbi:acyl-CoA thioesterase/bile acid-CoA:amino acid N-acyltransferase family protein [Actinomadura harenae]|uniref:acyl-CoA thioesterase/bile acid-CoA:amino acid N-acyltransferase family protein n=1 Tax=Actinomadura harenae TaxID=2483351 RepID=UPI002278D823|nr:acyl-CoA thioesterase/bile acid-CoA:amino acid N-acyltransferase family protein [Actinomadura harenae]
MAALVLVAGSLLAGCGEGRSTHAVLNADAPTALADRAVHISVSGLRGGERVSVAASAPDVRGQVWRGDADFRADAHGTVDLVRDRSTSGTYTGVDGMGEFWSMNPPGGGPVLDAFSPPTSSYSVTISVTSHGHRLAERTLTRQWIGTGVTHKPLTLAADKVYGDLFLPPPGTPRHPAVMLISGSGGGEFPPEVASLLASHGYPAMSLAYFGVPGLPPALQNIPLEYFTRAARLLASQPGVDPAHLVALGNSRGSEAALLLGQRYPALIHGVIVYVPSATVNVGYPSAKSRAWTDGGRPVPLGFIPVDHISGPVLAIAGSQDRLWPSETAAREITSGLDAVHDRFPHRALVYQGAGHGVDGVLYLPEGTTMRHPLTGAPTVLGGTRPATAAAQRQAWDQVLGLLAAL